MADVERIDHTELGLSRLPSHWEDKPKAYGLVKALLSPFNEVEDLLLSIRDGRDIYSAIGVQLDMIGALFGMQRESRSDDIYRLAILARAVALGSGGTVEQVIEALRVLAQTEYVKLFEHDSGEIHLYMGEGATHSTWEAMKDTVAAGVRLRIYMDEQFSSVTPREATPDSYHLWTGEDSFYVDSGEELHVNIRNTQQGAGGFVSELGETDNPILMAEVAVTCNKTHLVDGELAYSLCALPLPEVPFIGGDSIVDDEGNNLIDDESNQVVWTD